MGAVQFWTKPEMMAAGVQWVGNNFEEIITFLGMQNVQMSRSIDTLLVKSPKDVWVECDKGEWAFRTPAGITGVLTVPGADFYDIRTIDAPATS